MKSYRESENTGLTLEVDKSPYDTPFKRSRRTSKMDLAPGSVDAKALGKVVQRTLTSTSSFATVPDNRGSTLTVTITVSNGVFFLPQVFVSPYVSQISPSNKWPSGSYFSAATAVQTASNYDLASFFDAESSDETQVVYRARLNNHTGATVTIAWKVSARLIINGAGSRGTT